MHMHGAARAAVKDGGGRRASSEVAGGRGLAEEGRERGERGDKEGGIGRGLWARNG